MPIPQTRVRLKGYIRLTTVAGGQFLDPTSDIAAQLQAIPPGDIITLGAAQSLVINQTREENQVYRQFVVDPSNPEKAAKPVESYPGLISYSIDFSRIDLNDINLSQAFRIVGGNQRNIVEQFKPLIVFVNHFVPEGIRIGGQLIQQPAATIIIGCWFNSLPIGYDITDTNQAYLTEISMIASDVI